MIKCKMKNPCKFCGSKEGIIRPSYTMHPARLDCADCGMYQRWLNKLETAHAKKIGVFNMPSPEEFLRRSMEKCTN